MSAVENFVNILHRLVTDYAGAEFDTSYGDSELIIVWRKPLPSGNIREVWLECDTSPVPRSMHISAGITDDEGRRLDSEIKTFWFVLDTFDCILPPKLVSYMDEHFKRTNA